MIRRGRVGLAITTLAIAAIAVATLRPDWSEGETVWRLCLVCGDRPVADVLANVILFLPLGVGLALAGVRERRIWISGALLSSLVELIQLILPGRDASVGDVAFNTLGVAAGAASVTWFPRMCQALSGRSWGAGVSAAAIGLAVAATGWLFGPSFPDSTYWGQWTPLLGHLAWYRGHVLHAEIGGRTIPSHRVADSRAVRASLSAAAPISVEAVAGPPVTRLAPLFSMADEASREITLVGIQGDDLVFRWRTRAWRFGLDQPDIRFLHGMSDVGAGDPLRVSVTRKGTADWCIAVNGRTACGLGITAGRGWALISFPPALPDWMRNVLDGLWLAALAFPLGLALRPSLLGAAALSVAVVVLIVGSRWVGLLPPGLPGWGGFFVGLGTGGVVARLAWRPSGALEARHPPRPVG